MTFEESLSLLSDAEIEVMRVRAYARAANGWSEVRRWSGVRGHAALVNMLSQSVMSEEAFLNALLREISQRKKEAVNA